MVMEGAALLIAIIIGIISLIIFLIMLFAAVKVLRSDKL